MLKFSNAFPSFSVSDVADAKRFYGGTLGLDVKDAPMGNLEVMLPGGSHLTIYPKQNHQPATFTVLNLMVADVESAVDQLGKAGIEMEHYDMPGLKTNDKGIAGGTRGEPRIAWFKDPFGNILSVIDMPEGGE